MSEHTNSLQLDQRKVRQVDAHSLGRDTTPVSATEEVTYLPSLLGEAGLDGRGSDPVRNDTMLRAQQVHGNRAVQRAVHSTGGRVAPIAVQRSWYGDAASWVGDKASSGAGWVADKASDAASAVVDDPLGALKTVGEYMPIPGNPLAMMKTGHDINQLFGAGHDEEGKSTPSLFDRGVNFMEEGISSTAHSLADKVSDVPVLGTVANAGASAVDFTSQVSGGAWKALGGMVGGIGSMMEHPVETVAGLEKVGENFGLPGYMNPLRMGHGIYDVATGKRDIGDAANHWLNPIESQKQSQEFGMNMFMGQQGKDGERHGGLIEGYREAWNQGKYGEIVGRAGVDIGSFFIGAGEANAAGKAGEAGNALRGVSEAGNVAHGLEEAGQGAKALKGMEEAGQGTKAVAATADAADASGALRAGEESANALKEAPNVAEVPAGAPQEFVPDLSHVTGKGAQARNRAVDAVIAEDLPNLKLTHKPKYNPFMRTGIAKEGQGTQLGKNVFSSRNSLRDTIVHEELHHRWWERARRNKTPIEQHHATTYVPDEKFYEVIRRYFKMRGWGE